MDTSWLMIEKMAQFRMAQFLDLDGLVGHAWVRRCLPNIWSQFVVDLCRTKLVSQKCSICVKNLRLSLISYLSWRRNSLMLSPGIRWPPILRCDPSSVWNTPPFCWGGRDAWARRAGGMRQRASWDWARNGGMRWSYRSAGMEGAEAWFKMPHKSPRQRLNNI